MTLPTRSSTTFTITRSGAARLVVATLCAALLGAFFAVLDNRRALSSLLDMGVQWNGALELRLLGFVVVRGFLALLTGFLLAALACSRSARTVLIAAAIPALIAALSSWGVDLLWRLGLGVKIPATDPRTVLITGLGLAHSASYWGYAVGAGVGMWWLDWSAARITEPAASVVEETPCPGTSR